MNLRMPPPVALEFDFVVDQGRAEIERVLLRLREHVIKALEKGATWHPTGFMVLPLVDVDDLGLIRLHIWPRTNRIKRAENPEIHSHCFHLMSYVLEGVYVEHQFDVTEVENDPGAYHGYRVLPATGDGLDRIAPDGITYQLRKTATEVTSAGSFHSLVAGVYHMTDIGEHPAATIALISRPQPGRHDHLIGPEVQEALVAPRESVDPKILMKNLLRLGVSLG